MDLGLHWLTFPGNTDCLAILLGQVMHGVNRINILDQCMNHKGTQEVFFLLQIPIEKNKAKLINEGR